MTETQTISNVRGVNQNFKIKEAKSKLSENLRM
jgi:hypothetical protein